MKKITILGNSEKIIRKKSLQKIAKLLKIIVFWWLVIFLLFISVKNFGEIKEYYQNIYNGVDVITQVDKEKVIIKDNKIINNLEKEEEEISNILKENNYYSDLIDNINQSFNSDKIIFTDITTGSGGFLEINGMSYDEYGNSLKILAETIEKLKEYPNIKDVQIVATSKNYLSESLSTSGFKLNIFFTKDINTNDFLNFKGLTPQESTKFKGKQILPKITNLKFRGEALNPQKGIIYLYWDKLTKKDIYGYAIFKGDSIDNLRFLDFTAESFYEFETTIPNKEFFFAIYAINAQGDISQDIDIIQAMAGDKIPPQKITNLQIKKEIVNEDVLNTAQKVKLFLSWDKNEDYDFYRYAIYAGLEDDQLKLIDYINNNNYDYIATDVINKTKFKIVVIDKSGNESE